MLDARFRLPPPRACRSLIATQATHLPSLVLHRLHSAARSSRIATHLARRCAGLDYEFPRDHLPHPEFKTEWWYFTGNCATKPGGNSATSSRFSARDCALQATRSATASRLIMNDLPFAHFAISDPSAKRFVFQQKLSRGAFDEAGFGSADRLAWIGDWQLGIEEAGAFRLHAATDEAALDLKVGNADAAWAIHGAGGISQKAAGEGRASHYYSGTRMETRGTLTLAGERFEVSGESWFDHEWATNQLTPEQAGWNWFSLQFGDGTELMLYQMRLRDGGVDPYSSGTWIGPAGMTQHLAREDYQLTPTRFWTSRESGARYPVAWQLAVPRLGLRCSIETPLDAQELSLKSIAYWEGMIRVAGTRNGREVSGQGYMELTGYAGALTGLSSPE